MTPATSPTATISTGRKSYYEKFLLFSPQCAGFLHKMPHIIFSLRQNQKQPTIMEVQDLQRISLKGPKTIRTEFWGYNKNLSNNFLAFSALLWSQQTKQIHLLQDHLTSPHQAWIICSLTHTGSLLTGLLLVYPSPQYRPLCCNSCEKDQRTRSQGSTAANTTQVSCQNKVLSCIHRKQQPLNCIQKTWLGLRRTLTN